MPPKDIFYQRNLPHIHPERYPLFITFRLAHSLPNSIVAELKAQREREIRSLKNETPDQRHKAEERHFACYDEWLDRCSSGPRWLESENIARLVAEKIHEMEGKHYRLLAYCIMPNHAHLLIEAIATNRIKHYGKTAPYPVTDTLRLLKGSTPRSCNLKLERDGHFWHHESYDHYARNEMELERIILYMLNNPVKAGLVHEWKEWLFTYVNPDLGEW